METKKEQIGCSGAPLGGNEFDDCKNTMFRIIVIAIVVAIAAIVIAL